MYSLIYFSLNLLLLLFFFVLSLSLFLLLPHLSTLSFIRSTHKYHCYHLSLLCTFGGIAYAPLLSREESTSSDFDSHTIELETGYISIFKN